MPKLLFKKEINALPKKVYETMLGLNEKGDYEYWTAAFNPTCTYEGTWKEGSKILFIGMDDNGKKAGMVSKIVQNKPGTYVSICHCGFIDGDNEITTGEQVEKWIGCHENYTFEEIDNSTVVFVEMDCIDEYVDYFNSTYPQALNRLKEMVEK